MHCKQVFERTNEVSDELGQAVATVEFLGSGMAWEKAQAIYEAAGKAGDIFSARGLAMHQAQKTRTRLGP
jgi:hypothetical protein